MNNASSFRLAGIIPSLALMLSLASMAPWALGLSAKAQADATSPTPLRGLAYTNDFFPGARYRATVPTQQTVVDFPNGQRAASATEIAQCLRAWA